VLKGGLKGGLKAGLKEVLNGVFKGGLKGGLVVCCIDGCGWAEVIVERGLKGGLREI
jgi:hypothetical protein